MNIQVKCEPQKKFDKAKQHKSDVTGYSNVAGKLLTFSNECSTLGATPGAYLILTLPSLVKRNHLSNLLKKILSTTIIF